MDANEAGAIGERLAGLEKSLRHYRAALAAVGLMASVGLVGLLPVGAQKTPVLIQANRFEVVDYTGTVRAYLHASADGAELMFGSNPQNAGVALYVQGDSASLEFYDKATRPGPPWPRVELHKDASRLTDLSLSGKGFPHAWLGVLGDDTGVVLFDKAGKARCLGTCSKRLTEP